MKVRTVMVTLELETAEPLKLLRARVAWQAILGRGMLTTTVRQVTVSVAQPVKRKK